MSHERQLRARSGNKQYNENESDADSDEAFLGPIGDKVDYAARIAKHSHYDDSCVLKVQGKDLTRDFFDARGLSQPLLIGDPEGLGIRVPRPFTVTDVLTHIADPEKRVEVIDVERQNSATGAWSLQRWLNYYNTPLEERNQILNVISLEFSRTPLSKLVKPPKCVRGLDWAAYVWPDSRTKPKVEKYCLMSVQGSYTDFHIDLGGTSVWYHVLNGEKHFYFIPPTEENLAAYTQWSSSPDQSRIFLGDLTDSCYLAVLRPGWIHAVYTPYDSLVFGGNYLHSYGIAMQLKVNDIEERTKVDSKFRYPMFEAMQWYAAKHFVLNPDDVSSRIRREIAPLVRQLRSWAASSKHRGNIPSDIDDASDLLDSMERMFLVPKLTIKPSPALLPLKLKLNQGAEPSPGPETLGTKPPLKVKIKLGSNTPTPEPETAPTDYVLKGEDSQTTDVMKEEESQTTDVMKEEDDQTAHSDIDVEAEPGNERGVSDSDVPSPGASSEKDNAEHSPKDAISKPKTTQDKDQDWARSDTSDSDESDFGIRPTGGKRSRVLESDTTDDDLPASRPKVLKSKSTVAMATAVKAKAPAAPARPPEPQRRTSTGSKKVVSVKQRIMDRLKHMAKVKR